MNLKRILKLGLPFKKKLKIYSIISKFTYLKKNKAQIKLLILLENLTNHFRELCPEKISENNNKNVTIECHI